jgi:long-chain acyl-CoA synthetase
MGGVVLVTGATGFLGTEVARRLLDRTRHTLVALVLAPDEATARRELERAWWDAPELAAAIGDRVEVLAGDVAAPHLGLNQATWRRLAGRVSHIVHLAADLRLTAPLDELRRTNVTGVANVLELARAAHRDHGLARLAHVSTAYVAGLRRGEVPEDELTDAFGFANGYERTKFEAERLVRAAMTELPVTVLRPSMVVGDSRTGAIQTFNTVYAALRLYLTGRLRVLPARPGLRLNIVPVDWVADAIVRLAFEPAAEGVAVHLTAPFEALPRADETLALTRRWAAGRLGVRLPRPLAIPLPQRVLDRAARPSGLAPLLPYLRERRRFRRDHADRLLGPYDLDWRAFLPRLLAYATDKGFMHRRGRTVHEQLLARLRSRSRPVRYADLAGDVLVERDSGMLRRDMLAAAGALRRLGVGPGDRVAVVGPNSTRYLTVEVAIGLAGAVSVPVHPLSPPAEIDRVVTASGARLLLVGSPEVLARLAELRQRPTLVSFCPGMAGAEAGPRPLGWDEFLGLGQAHPGPEVAPVGPGDLATIRYTSGTTGTPKGVAFTHGQLVWMAETMAGLLPWTARTRPAAYLSFLPMNHVVEGILGTWAPYWLPAPVRITFLDDFRAVARALPMVRPTLFFCVPRLYEKAWAALAANRLGRRYLGGAGRLERRLERPLLRRALLRRAGLDRCRQLIVGSAPVGNDLLRHLHELGVEVHNAYGLTEAPLVALNRHGRNVIGTVGQPLPGTAVRIAGDGEVLVRGPQVTGGYVGAGVAQPFIDGWLATGDLGHLTADGALVIDGRKKELIKTAYGKYLHPAQVEAMLRELPGVAEAMVVGEGRPFCAALLWTDEPDGDGQLAQQRIAEGMLALNARLPRPEQVRRWAVLPNDLSVERGDLTTHLKLRRATVARRLGHVIDALYEQAPAVGDAAVLGVAGEGSRR